jgi:hypothetical protein
MQLEQAEGLRKRWGDKPCNHPDVQKEYYNDWQTGDMICNTSGRVIYDEFEWAAFNEGTGSKLHNLNRNE